MEPGTTGSMEPSTAESKSDVYEHCRRCWARDRQELMQRQARLPQIAPGFVVKSLDEEQLPFEYCAFSTFSVPFSMGQLKVELDGTLQFKPRVTMEQR